MGKIRTKNLERNQEIKEEYLIRIKDSTSDKVIAELAKQNKLGNFYVRGILKDQGIEIDRKSKNDRKDSVTLNKRNERLIKLFQDTGSIEKTSKSFGLTTTRIRQILNSNNILIAEEEDTKDVLAAVKTMVESGDTYKTIFQKFGKNKLRELKQAGYNTFQEVLAKREKDIIQMYENDVAPKEIAEKYGVVRNYVYLILHKNGLRGRISPEERIKRNKSIKDDSENLSISQLAEKYQLTETMIKIILK